MAGGQAQNTLSFSEQLASQNFYMSLPASSHQSVVYLAERMTAISEE